MRYPPRWTLEGFPERVSDAGVESSGEVQKAYEAWRETRAVDPRRKAGRLQFDDVRYSAEVIGAHYVAVVDDERRGFQLMCDYEVIEGDWSAPGRVVYVEVGYVDAPDLVE